MRKLSAFIPERTRSTEPRTRPISIRLEPHLIGQLDTLAAELGTSRRGVIQAMIERETEARQKRAS